MESAALLIGDVLLDASPAWVSEETLVEASGLSGYGVRWYIYQLREAGFVIDAAMYSDREAFRKGARGWKLIDVRSVPYRPAGHVAPQSGTLHVGARFDHPKYGQGTVTVANDGAPKVVARFRKLARVELPRVEVERLIAFALTA